MVSLAGTRRVFCVESGGARRRGLALARLITLSLLLALGGCDGTSSHARTAAQRKVAVGSGRASGRTSILEGMTDEHKIQSMREANAARARALPIETEIQREIVRLHGEVMRRPGLSERERADKEQEIDRLGKQWKRLREPVEAFYKGLEHGPRKLNEQSRVKTPRLNGCARK